MEGEGREEKRRGSDQIIRYVLPVDKMMREKRRKGRRRKYRRGKERKGEPIRFSIFVARIMNHANPSMPGRRCDASK